jgi:membrane fusion protein, multidrug efflux system
MHIGRVLIGLVCLATLLVTGCADDAGGEAAARGAGGAAGAGTAGRGAGGAPIPVTVAGVERKSMPLEIRVIGSAEAYSTVAIRSQTTGQLINVNFREGDEVRQGQVLFELDRRPLEAALQQAQANLERDLAQAKNAEVQATRFAQLVERGIAPREQADTARTAVSALNATVEADRAAVENAKVQLQYATITAPIAGRTGALLVNAGNLVRANDATPLVTINQVAPVSVSFAIPESRLADLNRYLAQGTLQVTAAPPNEDVPSTGRIAFVDNAVDQNTGTIRIKATFPNVDRRLWPGQYVNVVVTLTTDSQAIVVPSAAVQAGPQGPYVFKVSAEQTVEMQPVTVARTRGAETVIANGVQPGETVVTDGHLRLVPGARINAKAQPAQNAVSAPPAPQVRQ